MLEAFLDESLRELLFKVEFIGHRIYTTFSKMQSFRPTLNSLSENVHVCKIPGVLQVHSTGRSTLLEPASVDWSTSAYLQLSSAGLGFALGYHMK